VFSVVNDIVFNYLKDNREKYGLEELKKQVISRGYSEADCNEAIKKLDSESEDLVPHLESKGGKIEGVKWIKFAAIIGCVFVGLMALGFIAELFDISPSLGSINIWVQILLTLFFMVLLGFYFFGFFKIGQKVESKWVRVSSIINIIFIALAAIIFIVLVFYVQNLVSGFGLNPSMTGLVTYEPVNLGGISDDIGGGVDSIFANTAVPSLIGWKMILVFGFFALMILVRGFFSVTLMSIKSKVKFSFVSSILGIIFGLFALLFLGYIFYLLSNPMEIITMFFTGGFNSLIWISRGISLGWLSVFLFETLALFSASKNFK